MTLWYISLIEMDKNRYTEMCKWMRCYPNPLKQIYIGYRWQKADLHEDIRFIGSMPLHFFQWLPTKWNPWVSGEAGPQFLLHRSGPGGVLPKCANCASIKEVCRAHRADEQQVLWDFSWQDSGRWEAQMQSRHLKMLYGSKYLTYQGIGK